MNILIEDLSGDPSRPIFETIRSRMPPGRLVRISLGVFLLAANLVLFSGVATAVELIEARLESGAEAVLAGAGTGAQIEGVRVGAIAARTFYLPEPGASLQLGAGVFMLASLAIGMRRLNGREF